MPTDDPAYTLLGLLVEHIKGVNVVQIEPNAIGVTKICGPNASGKSSTLDSVEILLRGKDALPGVPLHKGESSGRIVGDFGEFVVTRTITGTDDYLTIKPKGGVKPIKRPQEFLDALIGAGIGLDPLALTREKPDRQTEIMLPALRLTEDPKKIDLQIDAMYAERRDINRDAKALETRIAAMPLFENVPDEPVPSDEILAESNRLSEEEKAYNLEGLAVQSYQMERDAADKDVVDLTGRLEAARTRLNQATEKWYEADLAFKAKAKPDSTAFQTTLHEIQSTNALVAQKQEKLRLENDLLEKQVKSLELTEKMDELEAKKNQMFVEAPFPVPGMGFMKIGKGYQMTYKDIPLADCSQSEQLKILTSVSIALNPRIRVILIRDASLLDEASWQVMKDLAQQYRCQILCEVVGEGDDDSFVLRDGGVIRAPKRG